MTVPVFGSPTQEPNHRLSRSDSVMLARRRRCRPRRFDAGRGLVRLGRRCRSVSCSSLWTRFGSGIVSPPVSQARCVSVARGVEVLPGDQCSAAGQLVVSWTSASGATSKRSAVAAHRGRGPPGVAEHPQVTAIAGRDRRIRRQIDHGPGPDEPAERVTSDRVSQRGMHIHSQMVTESVPIDVPNLKH
jgi:hypothetical protein